MKIRLTFIILAILSTIGLVLVLAKYPTGPHTINYNEPYTVLIAITTIVIMALPALILGIFNHLACRIISAILQISALMIWGFLGRIYIKILFVGAYPNLLCLLNFSVKFSLLGPHPLVKNGLIFVCIFNSIIDLLYVMKA